MKYVMKQKLFSFGDDFDIQNEHGDPCFHVDGKALSIGDKASFEDMHGRELLRIEQQLLSIGKKYHLLRNGSKVGTIKKKPFTLFRDVFDVEDAAAGDLDATGDFIDHEYTFTRDGNHIASVSKKLFAWTDTYGVDVVEGEDDVLILACTVAIDMCCHDD